MSLHLILIRTKCVCGQHALLLPWKDNCYSVGYTPRLHRHLHLATASAGSGCRTWIGPESLINWKTGWPQVPVMSPPWVHKSHNHVIKPLFHAYTYVKYGLIIEVSSLLCLPYEIGQAIIFFPFGFYLLSIYRYLFFPRLISAAADWMSTILPHMVWP